MRAYDISYDFRKTAMRYAIAEASDDVCVMVGDGSMLHHGPRPQPGYETVFVLRAGRGDDITDRDGRDVCLVPQASIYSRATSYFVRTADVLSRGPEPVRDPGTPPDDCPCGCEGDVESHRGGATGRAYRRAGM